MTAMQTAHYQNLAKRCGVYPIACKMRNEGYSIQVAIRVLAAK